MLHAKRDIRPYIYLALMRSSRSRTSMRHRGHSESFAEREGEPVCGADRDAVVSLVPRVVFVPALRKIGGRSSSSGTR